MWYEILIENEFAEYFMSNEKSSSDSGNEGMTTQMLEWYAEIVDGVTYAWAFSDSKKIDSLHKQIEKMGANIYRAFDFCHSCLPLTTTKSLSAVWKSIPLKLNESRYDVDIELLNAEQCAVLIMYPFWSRMGGSFEDDFQKSRGLKKYLCALKSKCAKQ